MFDSKQIVLIGLLVLSPYMDILNFMNLIQLKLETRLKKYLIIIFGTLILIAIEIFSQLLQSNYDPIATSVEILLLISICFFKKTDIKLFLSAGLIVSIIDLINDIVVNVIEIAFNIDIFKVNVAYCTILILEYIVICKYAKQIYTLLVGINRNIILYALVYLYISSTIAYIIASVEQRLSTGLCILLGILLIQGIYTIINLRISIKTQQNIIKEAHQKYLEKENQQLISNNQQLKEYANYLEKDEDRLIRFKHDYRNILNSLKLSAKQEDTIALINQLDEYTNEQFDTNIMDKFKDVNHIHNDLIKSILITKLSKIYNSNIVYNFSCEEDIYDFPLSNSGEYIDITRIIGIAFDNAIEASESKNNSKIEAMIYQEKKDLEFVIRNKIDEKIENNVIVQEGYTTKSKHLGLGLNNVLKIVQKYPNKIIVDINNDTKWFTFSLVVLPTDIIIEGDKN